MITLKQMKAESTIDKALELAKTYSPPFPKLPKSPTLPTKENIEEAKGYIFALEQYMELKLEYSKKLKEYQASHQAMHDVVMEYVKDLSGFDSIPQQYQSKAYQYVCARSSASGYYDVYYGLCDLVEIFNVN